jgi:hypothetical protein
MIFYMEMHYQSLSSKGTTLLLRYISDNIDQCVKCPSFGFPIAVSPFLFNFDYSAIYFIIPLIEMRKAFILALLALLALLPLLHARKGEDVACQGIRCAQGFRCKDGACIQQKVKARKHFCASKELAGRIRPDRCEPKERTRACTGAKNVLTCGLAADGSRRDFTNDCSPCLDANIESVVRLPCADVPPVCAEMEECINGQCFGGLFSQDTDRDRNRAICVKSVDCDPDEICVASKCVERHELLKTLRKGKDSIKS